MKKLMIAAAVAALAGASFAECQEAVKCPFAYRMKVMVRTTASYNVAAKSACEAGGCYRNPEIRRFIGFVYGSTVDGGACDGCQCNGWSEAKVALWDFDARKAVDFTAAELFLLDRVGSLPSDNRCEMCFELNTFETCEKTYAYGALFFSGFGKTGIHDGNVTVGSVAGYCAGYLPSFCRGYDAATCGEDCAISTAWDLCTGAPVNPPFTAAYGKWTLTWDSGAAAQVGNALADKAARIDGVVATPVKMGDLRGNL